MNIYLKGYFGKSNLGDDLLMIASTSIIKILFADANVYCVSSAKYIDVMEPRIIRVDNQELLPTIDLLIHGGGGVFFDFKEDGSSLLQNTLLGSSRLGFKMYLLLRKLFSANSTDVATAGWSLGVGSYSKNSRKYLPDLYKLSRFKFLGVRDNETALPIAALANPNATYCFTDIVFHSELWLEGLNLNTNNLSNNEDTSVAIVLRDWNYDKLAYPEIELARKLINNGVNVRFYLFGADGDASIFNRLKHLKFQVINYDPAHARQFIASFSQSSVIVTQRAHGAIVGNVLGIPSICVEIETKLRNIHQMMPNSTRLVSVDFSVDTVVDLIMKELDTGLLKENCANDNAYNVIQVQEMIKLLKGISFV
ncbi:MAG: polysaccharide pyruvyl transferase family protein [Nonlabens sp.]